MSFSRTKYDKCATRLQNGRSVGVGDYYLFAGAVENCNQCYSDMGPIGSKSDVSTTKNHSLDWGEMAQIESELLSRNIDLSKCNNNVVNMNYNKHQVYNKSNCNAKLNAEDTRFTFPVQTYRSMSLTSYQLQPYLYTNPQCYIQDDRLGLDSRNRIKDAYIASKDVPNVNTALPKENTQKL